MGRQVADQFSRDGRRRPQETACDLSNPVASLGERRDSVALEPRQIPARVVLLRQARRRHPNVFLTPPKPGLSADADLAASLHSAHAGGK
jgi:hypothetical protein